MPTHLSRWMWCAGMKKKSPDFKEAAFSPCISSRDVPLTARTLASAECQCVRLSHDGASFMSTLEGPLLGSPRSTATVKQSGTLGSVANFAAANFVVTAGWPDCCANAHTLKHSDAHGTTAKKIATGARFLRRVLPPHYCNLPSPGVQLSGPLSRAGQSTGYCRKRSIRVALNRLDQMLDHLSGYYRM